MTAELPFDTLHKTMSKRIVFLDFDGVLNSGPFLASNQRGEAGAIDPDAVLRLNRLLEETDADVVISSSWRHGRSRVELHELLKDYGFVGEVIGMTPKFVPNADPLSKRHCGERGHEIQDWLDRAADFGHDVESFVILDDNSDMAHLLDRLVQTDMREGLTDAHVDRAVKLLMQCPHDGSQLIIVPLPEMIARFEK